VIIVIPAKAEIDGDSTPAACLTRLVWFLAFAGITGGARGSFPATGLSLYS